MLLISVHGSLCSICNSWQCIALVLMKRLINIHGFNKPLNIVKVLNQRLNVADLAAKTYLVLCLKFGLTWVNKTCYGFYTTGKLYKRK